MNDKMKQMRDEPEGLKGMKRVLEFFKPEGLQSLLLNLRKFKQKSELAGAQTKMNLMNLVGDCLLYTSPSPRDVEESRMPSSA